MRNMLSISPLLGVSVTVPPTIITVHSLLGARLFGLLLVVLDSGRLHIGLVAHRLP